MSDAPKLSKNEALKIASGGLIGPIADEIMNKKSFFEEDTTYLLKHHGTYQQDNRDTRIERKRAGLEKEFSMMVRTKAPGGFMTPEQYVLCDDLADKYGQHDLRITSRQGFQFHGVVKGNLRALIHDLNHFQKITTQGACGDVVRNVMACPVVDVDMGYKDGVGARMMQLANEINTRFLAKSGAYYELFLDDERVKVTPEGEVIFTKDTKPKEEVVEPIYGKTYLPRKFKIGIATDFDNSIDVYTQDIGIIAATKDGVIIGYEVLAGGGLGHSHSKTETYARLGTPVCFVDDADLLVAVEAIVKVQRDFGNRAERHQARLKYTIDRMGQDAFIAKVHEYAGKALPASRGIKPSAQPDYLGWHKQHQPGMNYVGVWVENGRVKDVDGHRFRTGLRAVVEKFKPSIRLTGHHNVIFANIADKDVAAVQHMLDEYGLPTDKGIAPLRRREMACPALPLCGLALSEAERALPGVLDEVAKLGHAYDDVVIRMTGCPNSCARPETAELGIIGRGPDKYNVYAGGDRLGTRMNTLVAENVTTADLPKRISALFAAWHADHPNNGVHFGDWANGKGVEALKAIVTG